MQDYGTLRGLRKSLSPILGHQPQRVDRTRGCLSPPGGNFWGSEGVLNHQIRFPAKEFTE